MRGVLRVAWGGLEGCEKGSRYPAAVTGQADGHGYILSDLDVRT